MEDAMTSTKKDPVLVVLQLSGGNDYMNTLVPYTDPLYRDYRQNVSIPENDVLVLDDHIGLHPSMGPLKCLYDPSNIIMGGVENWLEGVDLISKHLAHVQLKGLMRGDMTYGYNFTRPCSEYDLTPQKEFLNKLKNIGYND